MYHFDGGLWSRKDCVFMKHMWMKLNYIPVLNVLLITDSLITQDLYFKENQFEGSIISFLG